MRRYCIPSSSRALLCSRASSGNSSTRTSASIATRPAFQTLGCEGRGIEARVSVFTLAKPARYGADAPANARSEDPGVEDVFQAAAERARAGLALGLVLIGQSLE